VNQRKYWQINDKPPCAKEVDVHLDYKVHLKIVLATKEMGSVEWFGYLLGKMTKKGIYINDIYIPEQEVSVARVEVTERVTLENIVGTVHSHGFTQHQPFRSTTDKEFLAANHPVCLVTTGGDHYYCSARIKAPCGKWVNVDGNVILNLPKEDDIDDFLDQLKTKCRRDVKVQYRHLFPGWEEYL